MWPTKWSTNLKDDKLLPDISGVGVVSTATNGGSPYALPSFVSDHQGVFNGGAATSSSGDPLYDTINTMTQAQSTSIYTPPLGSSLGKNLSWLTSSMTSTQLHYYDSATLLFFFQSRCIVWFFFFFFLLYALQLNWRRLHQVNVELSRVQSMMAMISQLIGWLALVNGWFFCCCCWSCWVICCLMCMCR